MRIIHSLIHILVLLSMPPLLLGVIAKTKALFAGRTGPSLWQPYYNIAKLMRKGFVISTVTTWVFRAGPVVTLVALLLAGLLVPFGRFDAPIGFTGDLILFIYLFGLARFFTTVAALDTGSPFEGMGAARELTFACLAEPGLLFALLVLVKVSGSLDLNTMLHAPLSGLWHSSVASLTLVAVGFFIIILAENSRIPVDDPNTHLELTMIHEVMVLDHSGPLMGIIHYAAAVKLFILTAVILHIVAPYQTGWVWLDWGLFAGHMLGVAVVIGVIESIMARLQMRHVLTLLVGASLLCGFGFLLLVRS